MKELSERYNTSLESKKNEDILSISALKEDNNSKTETSKEELNINIIFSKILEGTINRFPEIPLQSTKSAEKGKKKKK